MKAVKIGAVKFRSRSAAVRNYLKRSSKLTQTAIAQKCGVSVPCVNQIKSKMLAEASA